MAGRHVAPNSNERRTALLILAVGSAAALASMLGNIWMVRGGVVIAVVMATIALFAAFKQIDRIRAEHSEALRYEVDQRRRLTEKHHADSVAMIERFNTRTENLNSIIIKLRSQLGAAKAELSSMRGNAAWLRSEVAERQARIDELTARIAELESRIEEESKVLALPAVDTDPQVTDIWADDEHPTLVDMKMLQLDDEFFEEEQDQRQRA